MPRKTISQASRGNGVKKSQGMGRRIALGRGPTPRPAPKVPHITLANGTTGV